MNLFYKCDTLEYISYINTSIPLISKTLTSLNCWISLTDVVLVCISTFLIVMFAKKFFWEKLLTLIQKRQDLIQENIDSSVAIKKQAEDVKEQYDEKLRNVSQEAHTILVSARAHADQEKQQIIKEANDEALRIKKNANEDIERQKRDAQKEMKNE